MICCAGSTSRGTDFRAAPAPRAPAMPLFERRQPVPEAWNVLRRSARFRSAPSSCSRMVFERLSRDRSRSVVFLLRPASDSRARFSCARSSSRFSRSSSSRATEIRELARWISSAVRRRDRGRAKPLPFRAICCSWRRRSSSASSAASRDADRLLVATAAPSTRFPVPSTRREFAHLALQHQRSARFLAAAGQHAAV